MISNKRLVQQLSREREELLIKTHRLASFIVQDGPKLSSELHLALLNNQLRSMESYLESIDARILYLREQN